MENVKLTIEGIQAELDKESKEIYPDSTASYTIPSRQLTLEQRKAFVKGVEWVLKSSLGKIIDAQS